MKNQTYTPVTDEYAVVTAISHPLVRASGFSTIKPQEVVVFEDGNLGQVVAFDQDEIDIMRFSNTPVNVGARVTRTNQRLEFTSALELAGTICDPLGEVLVSSQHKSVGEKKTAQLDVTPPPLSDRARISAQLITGFSLVDTLLPLGHGQRELVIGGRKTGKTTFLLETAQAQATLGNHVVYCLVAKKKSEIKRVFTFFKEHNVLEHVTLVVSTPEDPASTISLTPFSAMAIAEQFKASGTSSLVIIDDLSTHAQFYRELSLLAKSFPGRESYPGDMFYTHARLLERAGNFKLDDQTTVSITCLAAAEIQNDDLTDFITSNLISITDGHLFFDARLFAKGRRPAINTYLSVTRVGKQTQSVLLRDMNTLLTAFLNKYEKTKELTHFGSELSSESKQMIERGKLITDFFHTPQHNKYSTEQHVLWLALIWSGVITTLNYSAALQEKILTHCAADKALIEKLLSYSDFDTLTKEMKPELEKHLAACQ